VSHLLLAMKARTFDFLPLARGAASGIGLPVAPSGDGQVGAIMTA